MNLWDEGLTLDVVSDFPGHAGIVGGLCEPADVHIPALGAVVGAALAVALAV